MLGVVYAIGFLVAINQIVPLIGSNGLLPVGISLKVVSHTLGSDVAGFVRLPSLFWLWHSDTALLTVAWIGFVLSCVVIAGFATGLTVIKSVGTKANVDLRLAEAAVLLTVALHLGLVALCAMSLRLGGHG